MQVRPKKGSDTLCVTDKRFGDTLCCSVPRNYNVASRSTNDQAPRTTINMACVMDMDIERFIRYEEEEEERKAFIEKYDTATDAVSELEHYERHTWICKCRSGRRWRRRRAHDSVFESGMGSRQAGRGSLSLV
mmetsp:Transcript_32151/g.84278  ORF Transcript_32151/g.84278 Transcript_32151/m.84278 type:complete len:133 (-) Transcript_32151:70-468(-)